ncbi:MAG TPA: MFS transporter [Sediminibacterium sp.]|nr:MFS transporter [Sediminibacterium sp.]
MKKLSKIGTFRAFKSRNYQLFFWGQLISRIGMWTQRTAVVWVIYTLTHSTVMIGLTYFAEQFPSFLLSIPGGIVADRYNRYKIMMLTQIASAIQAIALTVLVFAGHLVVWQILALSVLLGAINAFDVPARQPLVHDIIDDRDDLPNAIALNSTLNNLSRLIGPALAGILLAKFGADICFLLNALSFAAVIICLLLMHLPKHSHPVVKKKMLTDLAEGFRYIRKTKEIRRILLLLTSVCLLVLPYNTLLPVYAKVIFNGDSITFGYLNSFIGLGAVTGAFTLASLKPGSDFKKLLLINTVLLGISLLFFSYTTYFPLSLAIAVICGFGTMAFVPICNTILQMESDEHMRGRVISYFAMAAFGTLPLGSVITGAISRWVNTPTVIFSQGILALVIAVLAYRFLTGKLDAKEERISALKTDKHSLI